MSLALVGGGRVGSNAGADLNRGGGAINVGAAGGITISPATGQTLLLTGSLTYQGTPAVFQDGTTDHVTEVTAIPNGTALQSKWSAYASINTSVTGKAELGISTNNVYVNAVAGSNGTQPVLDLQISGTPKARVNTDGSFALGLNTLAFGADIGTNDTLLRRDGAAALLALDSGAANTATSNLIALYGKNINGGAGPTDYERLEVGYDASNTRFKIIASKGGSGASRALVLGTGGSARWSIDTSGHYVALSHNSYDIGGYSQMPRTLYVGTGTYVFNATITNDATNFERLDIIGQSAGAFQIMSNAGGTGTARQLQIGTRVASTLNFFTNNTSRWQIDSNGNMVPSVAQTTTMTSGFMQIPAAAGPPTGVPGASTGVPLFVDTTNHRLNLYYGGAWHYAQLTA